MTEEKTKEVTHWAKAIDRWTGIPQSWVWHLAEYHPESYEALRILTESQDESICEEVLSLDDDFNAQILLEIIKKRKGCAEWARKAFREENGFSLPPVEDRVFLKSCKETWEKFVSDPATFFEKAEYVHE